MMAGIIIMRENREYTFQPWYLWCQDSLCLNGCHVSEIDLEKQTLIKVNVKFKIKVWLIIKGLELQ